VFAVDTYHMAATFLCCQNSTSGVCASGVFRQRRRHQAIHRREIRTARESLEPRVGKPPGPVGTAARDRIAELEQQFELRQAEVQALQVRLKHVVEITPEKPNEFATVAKAEGVQPERGPAAVAGRGKA
jgi:hypothetical protein